MKNSFGYISDRLARAVGRVGRVGRVRLNGIGTTRHMTSESTGLKTLVWI